MIYGILTEIYLTIFLKVDDVTEEIESRISSLKEWAGVYITVQHRVLIAY